MVSYEERDAVLERVRGDEEAMVVAHGGGHFVPTDCRSVETACDFVRRCMLGAGKAVKMSRTDSGVGL
jgi:hypothetical protein